MAINVSKDVYDGLEKVRESGLTNMFDRIRVIQILSSWGEDEAAEWVNNNRDTYGKGIFEGFEVNGSQ